MTTRLSDVAARAGVSVKTVSNVINNYPHITQQTRAKVEAAIAALNYRPNVSARSLRKGRSDFIALAIPEMASPYFAELGAAISRAAKNRGITVLIDQTEGEAAAEKLVLEGMRGQLIDGIIFSPIITSPTRIELADTAKPLVLLGERHAGGIFDHVAVDSVQASFDATMHLVEIGRRRIAAIGVGGAAGTGTVRRKGYRKALKAAGLRHDPTLELAGTGYHRENGAASMRELLALPDPPDAVFCFNDLLALGALRTLAEAGLRVPEDVAVVGFDDIEDGRYHSPSLTTISPDKEWLAENAVGLLLERIAGDGDAERRDLSVPYTLQVRESTLGRRSARSEPGELRGQRSPQSGDAAEQPQYDVAERT